MAKPRCPICRSKRWHRDRASGQIVCQEGHILEGYLQEDNEADGVSAHVTKKRYLKKNRTRKEVVTVNPDLFHGPKLRFLYYQCAQIILRKQVKALIAYWELPPELETVARDLWAMYVSLSNLEPEPFKHVEEDDEDDKKVHAPLPEEDPLARYYETLSDSENDDQEETIIVDDDDQQMEENQAEDEALVEGQPRFKRGKKQKPPEPFDPAAKLQLQYTLVICYLSCLTLRIPILMKDLLDLAAGYKISYLEALKAIPADMRKHLEPVSTERDLLQAHILPVIGERGQTYTQSFIHLTTYFARMLNVNYDITFPDLNAAPVLWKCVREAALPPFFYLICRRVLVAISAPMLLEYQDKRARVLMQDYPDALLAGSLVLSCKLLWGLDGRARIPQDADDMAAGLPRLDAWLELAESMTKELPDTHIPKGARSNDVTELKGADIDDFLDFFQENLTNDLSEQQPRALGTLVLPKSAASIQNRFFPLNGRSTPASEIEARLSQQNARLQAFYSNLYPPLPGEAVDDEPLFPGQEYKLYNTYDKVGGLPADLERVLSLISGITGISPLEIEGTVARMERKLIEAVPDQRAGNTKIAVPPWEGYEGRTFGAVRQRGGQILRPTNLAQSYKPTEIEKAPAILEPKLRS